MASSKQVRGVSPKIDFEKTLDVSVLRRQSALVTGGASGLGLGIALALAEAGADVTVADISREAGEKTAQSAQLRGLNLQFVQTDVTSYPSQLNAFKSAIDFSSNKSLDIVVTSAGVGGESILSVAYPPDLQHDSDLPEPSVKTLDVSLTGTYYTTVLALHYFKATREKHRSTANQSPQPHLLMVCSSSGYSSLPLGTTYTASKWGIRGIFRSLREFPHKLGNVRINLLAPWFISTPITAPVEGDLRNAGIRFGSVADCVAAGMRVCCDESISGRAVAVNPPIRDDKPGSGNFDICDDEEGMDGAREYAVRWHSGLFFETEKVVRPSEVWGYEE